MRIRLVREADSKKISWRDAWHTMILRVILDSVGGKLVTKVQCKVCAMSISGYSLRMMLITPDV